MYGRKLTQADWPMLCLGDTRGVKDQQGSTVGGAVGSHDGEPTDGLFSGLYE